MYIYIYIYVFICYTYNIRGGFGDAHGRSAKTRIRKLRMSGSKCLENSLWTSDLGVSPLEFKNPLESNPLKSRLLVCELAVWLPLKEVFSSLAKDNDMHTSTHACAAVFRTNILSAYRFDFIRV